MLKDILVVSHDAGGANILSSLISKYKNYFRWAMYVEGPAKDIFSEKRIASYAKEVTFKSKTIDAGLKGLKPDMVLTGTGWGSDLEIDFIMAAKRNKIRSACFLDHWANYSERFGGAGDWKRKLPDIIFVGDRWAYRTALDNGFPRNRLRLVENPYFEEIVNEAESLKAKKARKKDNDGINLLYLSEPISRHALLSGNDSRSWGYTECEIVADLLKISGPGKRPSINLKIRLHPMEKKGKYNKMIKDKAVSITESSKDSLLKDCFWADVVVGSGSMAQVIALIAGKRAISYIPNIKKSHKLPLSEIKTVHSIHELLREIRSYKNNHSTVNKFFAAARHENLFARKAAEFLNPDLKNGQVRDY